MQVPVPVPVLLPLPPRLRPRRKARRASAAQDEGGGGEAAEDVPDVRSENAAVDVRLVDDDVGQVREHVAPPVVVRQHADVQHVGVREHEVRPLADLPAALGLGVAVVDGCANARDLQ